MLSKRIFTVMCLWMMLLMNPVFAQNQNTLSDTAITSLVKTKITSDTQVSDLNINIVTRQQEVSLIGTIETENQAAILVQLAAATPGVKQVDTTQLVVKKSEQPFTDLLITAKVEGLFIREQLMGNKAAPSPLSMHVETKNGVVYLTGTAANQAQIDLATQLAQGVKGVVKVNNKAYLVVHK